MNSVMKPIGRFAEEEEGVTNIEYALVCTLIAIVCLLTVVSVGTNLNNLYVRVCNQITTAISGTPAC